MSDLIVKEKALWHLGRSTPVGVKTLCGKRVYNQTMFVHDERKARESGVSVCRACRRQKKNQERT